jgi:hypothetical protein
MRLTRFALGILAIGVWLGPRDLYAQPQAIDVNKSSLKIRVFKSGAFSAFAHDHEIQAPIDEGKIDSSASPSVELRVDSRKMRVLDPEIPVDKRAEIQHTMQGNAVLDVANFPEISYRSTAITKTGDAHWKVRGNLNLHGKNRPVVLVVSLEAGHYRGSASFKQSDFGISPIRIAGGTVKVKDEVKIEFDIVPVQLETSSFRLSEHIHSNRSVKPSAGPLRIWMEGTPRSNDRDSLTPLRRCALPPVI